MAIIAAAKYRLKNHERLLQLKICNMLSIPIFFNDGSWRWRFEDKFIKESMRNRLILLSDIDRFNST
jgi:hypothetical protein